ncbi:hypothetical protein SO802_023689 [Lithocarpus litseifolius]|uniref:Reverse transcriptase domain-containing protein n=1 Tax=Lithocarpus litseifolius TaxID=425828 RepID=A0AAW2C874_9ROSI
MWKQRSRNAWLKEGDSNSRFFHCRANQRNRRNFIAGLEDSDGEWREDEGRIGSIIENYFQDIYTTSNPSGFEEILSGIHPAISEEDASLLGHEFQASEVKLAFDQMAPLTAPGPDGMSPIFYKSFWHIVGRDVSSVVLNALNSGVIPESLNSTFIPLIPKVKHPKRVADFRPNSLCNVVYKLISKVLVNRLKKFLASAIPETQSAFLSGRLILDNVLVAFETLHYLKRKTNGKVGQMALKLDMSKAYDRVEWVFLDAKEAECQKILDILAIYERRSAKEVGGLGFKEIENFNDALLAKQVWRLINNTDSLCHRVFKARFFPDCSILDAKDSSSGSYAWKSIIVARDVIRKGMVWCIGTGEAVRIKEDRWLPGGANRSVISPLPSMAPDVNVSSLIDSDRIAWRTEVVQQLFLPNEVDIILGIPLSARRPDDRIIWARTPSGTFTTSSAYKMLVSYDISNNAGSSNPDSQKKFWNSIWQLRVPNKIRHFVWRLCNNALPTLVNLHRRHIVPSPSCAQCHNFPEDSLHAVCICSKAGSYLQEFLQAQTEELVPPRPPPLQQWRPPDPHCLKINFDAAVFRRSSLAGIGVVVRNCFALELGITRVVFEGDSAVVINALLHGAGAFASFGNILDDIRVLSTAFQLVDFTFVSHCCNSVADTLAKKAKIFVGAQVWLHDVPADIAPLVLRDVH